MNVIIVLIMFFLFALTAIIVVGWATIFTEMIVRFVIKSTAKKKKMRC